MRTRPTAALSVSSSSSSAAHLSASAPATFRKPTRSPDQAADGPSLADGRGGAGKLRAYLVGTKRGGRHGSSGAACAVRRAARGATAQVGSLPEETPSQSGGRWQVELVSVACGVTPDKTTQRWQTSRRSRTWRSQLRVQFGSVRGLQPMRQAWAAAGSLMLRWDGLQCNASTARLLRHGAHVGGELPLAPGRLCGMRAARRDSGTSRPIAAPRSGRAATPPLHWHDARPQAGRTTVVQMQRTR